MTMNSTSEAMTVSCPFCGAESGQPCTARTTGRVRDWPHAQRRAASEPPRQESERRKALCCQCGHPRTVGANFYHRDGDPNYAGGSFTDKRGWRQTVSLKCESCGKSTRHALLPKPGANDWEELKQRFTLGGDPPSQFWDDEDRNRLRAEYFAQFPRNPALNHMYWEDEAKEAFAAGEKTITSLCGAPMDLDFDPSTPSDDPPRNGLIKPNRIDWLTEYEDYDTGMWWVEMDCVDCLAVTNRLRLNKQRDAIRVKLLEASEALDQLDATALAAVDEYIERLIGGAK